MTTIADRTAQHIASQSSFAADVFHKLSQPLTALHCYLELSLLRDQSAEEFRDSVAAALQNAERLRHELMLLRELSDADDPGDTSTPVDLQRLLLDLREDFLPLFESAGGSFHITCDRLYVRGNGTKLARAFFCLLEYLLQSSPGSSLSLDVAQNPAQQVEIRMTLSGAGPSSESNSDLSGPVQAGEVEIARRTFRALGGELKRAESSSNASLWIARLPPAE